MITTAAFALNLTMPPHDNIIAAVVLKFKYLRLFPQ